MLQSEKTAILHKEAVGSPGGAARIGNSACDTNQHALSATVQCLRRAVCMSDRSVDTM